MNNDTQEDRRGESLADQLASWVLPAARTPSPEPEPGQASEPDASLEPEPELNASVEPEPHASVEPDPAAERAPDPDLAADVEPDPAAERAPDPDLAADVELDPEQAAEGAPAGMADSELRAALEAVLLVVDEPVAQDVLAHVLEQPPARVAAALAALSEDYTAAGRGFDLRRAAGGWRLYTRTEQAPYVERFVLDGQQARLTQAALETLAVVAYRQPVTRSRISAIRGVNCDGVIRTLLTRGLVEESGTEPATGAHLYRTTSLFLEKLGLESLDQLPPLAPFLPDDVDALDPDAPQEPAEPAAVRAWALPADVDPAASPEEADGGGR